MDDTVIQTAGVVLGLVLTLMVYSYLLGDNPLYRLAVHVLVGVGVGYATIVVWYGVLVPHLFKPIEATLLGNAVGIEERVQPLVALLAVFMLLKLSPRTAALGNVAMGFVMGVGAAVAVGGAVLGTLLPQIGATALSLAPSAGQLILPGQGGVSHVMAALVVVAGTITSLLYFHFGAQPVSEDRIQRPRWVHLSAWVGQGFLMIAFGSLYAGALVASLSVLTERLQYYIQWFGW